MNKESEEIKINVNKKQFLRIFKEYCINYDSGEDANWNDAPYEVMDSVFRMLIGHKYADSLPDLAESIKKIGFSCDSAGNLVDLDTFNRRIWQFAQMIYKEEAAIKQREIMDGKK
jgi:hypothetical protein